MSLIPSSQRYDLGMWFCLPPSNQARSTMWRNVCVETGTRLFGLSCDGTYPCVWRRQNHTEGHQIQVLGSVCPHSRLELQKAEFSHCFRGQQTQEGDQTGPKEASQRENQIQRADLGGRDSNHKDKTKQQNYTDTWKRNPPQSLANTLDFLLLQQVLQLIDQREDSWECWVNCEVKEFWIVLNRDQKPGIQNDITVDISLESLSPWVEKQRQPLKSCIQQLVAGGGGGGLGLVEWKEEGQEGPNKDPGTQAEQEDQWGL